MVEPLQGCFIHTPWTFSLTATSSALRRTTSNEVVDVSGNSVVTVKVSSYECGVTTSSLPTDQDVADRVVVRTDVLCHDGSAESGECG